jgi:hypothetical protein
MTTTYTKLIEEQPRIAKEAARFDNELLLCGNCGSMPASASMSIAVGWIGCAPCITGEADSFDDEDLVLEELPA